jgi:thiamine biosynthesis lipoprotein ApbE
VNAGGDLRVFGPPRTVFVRPAHGAPVEQRLDDEALAVSDPCSLSPPPEHIGYYQRGRTTPPLVRAAVVVAPSAAVADALTKCVLLAPATLHREMLAQLGATALDIDVP